MFYKEGEKEEMACHGAVIVQRLIKNQKLSPINFNKEPLGNGTCFKEDVDLLRLVCADCPFEAHDCDFRASSPPTDSVPCGGYILLYLLKSKKLLSVKDVEEICGEES